MIDYFSEARTVATVKVTGNLSRTLGVALSHFHREQSDKIRRYEDSQEPERHYAVALLKVEIAEFERWHREVESLIAFQRASEAEYQANITDTQRRVA